MAAYHLIKLLFQKPEALEGYWKWKIAVGNLSQSKRDLLVLTKPIIAALKAVLPGKLDRNFAPSAPNQVWASDITYLWADEGWLYLAIVLDLFNREVVGWSLKPRMTADIVTDALTMAWFRPARVKVVVASVMLPTVEYGCPPNASL